VRSIEPLRHGRHRNEPAVPATRFDDAAGLEEDERPPQRISRDAQPCPEVSLGRKPLARCQAPGQDVGLESPTDLLIAEVLTVEIHASTNGLTVVHLWSSLCAVKLALLGGGGFRTPVIYRALARGQTRTRYDDIALYDVDSARLDRIEAVLRGIDEAEGTSVPYRTTTRLEEAVDGADVVYCAVRVGGLPGRLVDETVAIEAGAIGQETAGAGGLAFALRTVPVVTEIARVVDRRAPNALFINFTNPVGLVTEAVRRVLGDRVVGICDAPEDLCGRVAAALGRRPEELWFDYFGINHLGWLRGVLDQGRDLLPALLADTDRLESIEEGRLFGAEWLRLVGMIPNEYLYYFYFQQQALDAMRGGAVRAEYLQAQQQAFYAGDGRPTEVLELWQRTLTEREAHYMDEAWDGREDQRTEILSGRQPGGYGGLALGLVDALHEDGHRVRILNVANRSSLPFLDPDAVVEVPCVVGRGGIVPVAIGPVPLEAQALILAVRAAERIAIDAALTGSRQLAVKALALHPLVPSVDVATRILDGYLARQPELRRALR
jgi:6-phospho-beta-glucosidase